METSQTSDNLIWLKDFYSGRNQVKWRDIESKTASAKYLDLILSWTDSLERGDQSTTLVLPFFEADGSVTWYGMSTDDQEFLQLVDDIVAFIGPSYSDFRGEYATLKNSDPSEKALGNKFGFKVFKFRALQANIEDDIYNALQLYKSIITRRPDVIDRTQKPFGKLRSEFDIALVAGNEKNARNLLDELKLSGRVSAEQQKCFEIRLLSGLGRQSELACDHALLNSVTDLALPAQTLVDLILALYETNINAIENDQDLNKIITKFRETISKKYSGLFRERKGIRHVKVLRAFMLNELAESEPNLARIESLYRTYPEGGQGYDLVTQWFNSISNKISSKTQVAPPLSKVDQVKQEIIDENYLNAGDICLDLLPDPWAFGALLRCGEEAESAELTNKILAAVEKTSPLVIENLSPRDKNRLAKLKQSVSNNFVSPTSDWLGWADFVSRNPTDKSAISILKESAPKWAISDYINNADGAKKLATVLGNADANAVEVYREALPILVDFFLDQIDKPIRVFSPIYSISVKILGWSGSVSSDELDIVSSLLQSLLQVGLSSEEYLDSVEYVKEIFSVNNSPVHLDWALNISELLSIYPAPDKGNAKLNIFMDVISMVQAMVHRTSYGQRAVLESLAKDYGCLDSIKWLVDGSVDVPESNNTSSEFSGLIGIYTLTEGAGQRARTILEKSFPNAKIETNADYVKTDKLTSLAMNSDIFVFAWKSSKHQAYYCVKDARVGKSSMIMPSGKGTASIVRSCVEAINDV